jgi:hypothetical protein
LYSYILLRGITGREELINRENSCSKAGATLRIDEDCKDCRGQTLGRDISEDLIWMALKLLKRE